MRGGYKIAMSTSDRVNDRLRWLCPNCFNYTTDYPALSRKDNKTNICSDCGTREALGAYLSSITSERSDLQ